MKFKSVINKVKPNNAAILYPENVNSQFVKDFE